MLSPSLKNSSQIENLTVFLYFIPQLGRKLVMRKTEYTLIFLSLFLAPLHLAFAADEEIPIVENPLTVTEAKFVPSTVGRGATTELQVKISIVDKYKAYIDMFKLRPESPENLKVDQLKHSPTIKFDDPFSKRVREAVHDESVMKAIIEIPSTIASGEQEVKFAFTYQACTKSHCMFPKTIELKARLNVDESSIASLAKSEPAKTEQAVSSDGNESAFDKARKQGVVSLFLFVFFAGVLTSLTPCIYPLIPITLAVIGARAKEQTRMKSFLLSVCYVLGIATTYSVLGVGAASTGALFGAALSNIYIVTGIALLFVLMGLSMYGLYEVQAPSFVRDRLGNAKTGSGAKGAYISGLISGVVASPCIGPVLVTILTFIAQTGNKALGFGLLFTFAMGIGMLLIAVGTFSHLLGKLPKSGSWMEVVKFIFGTTMVGMAFFYIKPIYPQWLYLALLSLATVAIASSYGAFEPNEGLSSSGRIRKGLMILILSLGVFIGISALNQKLGLFQAASIGAGAAKAEHLPFQNYDEKLVAEAAASGKAVMIDFFADWCAACKELEMYTFSDPSVEKVLREKFVLLRVDATTDTPELQRLKEKYKVIGLPTLIFYDTKGNRRDDQTVTGFEEAALFAKRFESLLK